MIDAQNISVIYSGDQITYRSKKYGATLIDQVLHSIESIRKNWSTEVPIYFTHTAPLSEEISAQFKSHNVFTVSNNKYTFPVFSLANKINFAEVKVETPYLIFLDCDTVVHRPIALESTADVLVSYDALTALQPEEFQECFEYLAIPIPKGRFCESPALEYFNNSNAELFPAWNSGVFIIDHACSAEFARYWHRCVRACYQRFKNRSWAFYIEQVCFIASVFGLNLKYEILPKGYNFICTPRAPYLKDWEGTIYIEHYAGNTSKPMNHQFR